MSLVLRSQLPFYRVTAPPRTEPTCRTISPAGSNPTMPIARQLLRRRNLCRCSNLDRAISFAPSPLQTGGSRLRHYNTELEVQAECHIGVSEGRHVWGLRLTRALGTRMIRINLGGRQLTSSHVFFAHDLRTHGPFLPILLGGGSSPHVFVLR